MKTDTQSSAIERFRELLDGRVHHVIEDPDDPRVGILSKDILCAFFQEELSKAEWIGEERARKEFLKMLKEKPGEPGWSRAFNERLVAKLKEQDRS